MHDAPRSGALPNVDTVVMVCVYDKYWPIGSVSARVVGFHMGVCVCVCVCVSVCVRVWLWLM